MRSFTTHTHIHSKSEALLPGILCCALATTSAFADTEKPILPEKSTSPWSMSVGVVYREFDGGTFFSGSSSSKLSLPLASNSYVVDTQDAGDETSKMLRLYDNGFVGFDTLGTTSGSVFLGSTSRLGYDSNTQIQNNSLTFQSPVSGTATSSTLSSRSVDTIHGKDQEPGVQINLKYTRPVSNSWAHFDWNLGLIWSPYKLKSLAPNFFATRVDKTGSITGTLTDTYSFSNGVVLPNAPYSQTETIPGPGMFVRIDNTPTRVITSSIVPGSESTTEWFNLLDQQFIADIYSFSFGPETHVELGDSFRLSAAGGASLHLSSWKATLQETLYRDVDKAGSEKLENWNDRGSGLDALLGAYVQCGATYLFGAENRYSLQGFARWDWADNLEDSIGTSTFDISFDSFTAGASVGFTF